MKKILTATIVLLMAFSFALSGCAAAVTEEPAAATEEVAPAETATVTAEQPAAEPAAAEPQVGGTLHLVLGGDPQSLDIQLVAGWGFMENLMSSTLVALDPETGQYAPYLAESWTVSDDGLTYEFKLRQDVKFHNGDPLAANDFVYTIQRVKDPTMISPASGTQWGPVVAYEAVDDYTLKLTLAQPNYTFLLGLTFAPTQPLSQRAIEEFGDDYGRNPVGVGPYMFKEYATGEKVVLERNPDYTWGPSWVHPGPAYIQTIEFRIIPDYSTQLAGLEAGELDMVGSIDNSDISRLQEDGRFEIFELSYQGMGPFVNFNVSEAPFDNLNVRKAFNLAVNREALVTVALQGNGTPLYGPITEATIGYDPVVEELGYHFDLEQAKTLMQEAGYTYGDDGMLLTPEGDPFILDFTIANNSLFTKAAEILLDQYAALGVQMNIVLEDSVVNWQRQMSGDFQLSMGALGYNDAEMMYIGMHSSMIGAVNEFWVQDPTLDEILERTRSETDPTARQAAVTEAQEYIIEQAYLVPLYNQEFSTALNQRIHDLQFAPSSQTFWFVDAYIGEE